MKATKALKRLAKIEALMSDVMERYSATGPDMREMLRDAKAAVTRAKEAVSLQASTRTAKNPPVKHSKPPSGATSEPSKRKPKLFATTKKVAAKAPSKAARKTATKKPQNTVAKVPATVPVGAVTQ